MKLSREDRAAVYRLLTEHLAHEEVGESQVNADKPSAWGLVAMGALFLALALLAGIVILDLAQTVWDWTHAA